MLSNHWRSSIAVLVLVLVAGCAGYRLGPSNGDAAGSKSVLVMPFSNRTLEPRLGDALTTQLRKELQGDGTFKLATRDEGDVVVQGAITDYDRQEVSFVPTDVLTVRDYRLSMTAQVTARRRSTGQVLLDQRLTGYTLIRVTSDLASTERQALPLLADDLARRISSRLVDGSW